MPDAPQAPLPLAVELAAEIMGEVLVRDADSTLGDITLEEAALLIDGRVRSLVSQLHDAKVCLMAYRALLGDESPEGDAVIAGIDAALKGTE